MAKTVCYVSTTKIGTVNPRRGKQRAPQSVTVVGELAKAAAGKWEVVMKVRGHQSKTLTIRGEGLRGNRPPLAVASQEVLRAAADCMDVNGTPLKVPFLGIRWKKR